MSVKDKERDRKSVFKRGRYAVCENERGERESEIEIVCVSERESVCEREREIQAERVCVQERERCSE